MNIIHYSIAVTVLILIVGLLTACTGKPAATSSKDMQTRCLEGVTYYVFREDFAAHQGYGYMAPKFNRAGGVVHCNEVNIDE